MGVQLWNSKVLSSNNPQQLFLKKGELIYLWHSSSPKNSSTLSFMADTSEGFSPDIHVPAQLNYRNGPSAPEKTTATLESWGSFGASPTQDQPLQ